MRGHTMGPVETALRAAWARIEDPSRRCFGVLARGAHGLECDPYSPNAAQWCAVGALYAVDGFRAAYRSLKAAAFGLGYESPAAAHDSTNGEATPIMYAEAIAEAAREGL